LYNGQNYVMMITESWYLFENPDCEGLLVEN
jgi:hypothetical protein